MSLRRSFSLVFLSATVELLTLACSNSPQRQALSVTVSPATATAPSSGQAQFTAAGTYNTVPTTVNPLTANWAVVDSASQPTTAVTVSTSGLAQCTSTASGTYSVGAWVTQFSQPPTATCNVITGYGNPCGDSVIGTAQLTCP